MLNLWIALAGPPGAGKSSLSQAAGCSLQESGLVVDVCGEDELFTRPEFVGAAKAFRGPGSPSPEDLEAAYETWVDVLPRLSVAVTDWHPAGMAGDLPWAVDNHLRLQRHLEVVRGLAAHAVVINLSLPVEVATDRAAAERGEAWLCRSDQVARAAGHTQPHRLARIYAATEAHTARTALELQVAAAAGWEIEQIDASGSPALTLNRALHAVGGIGT